MSFRLFKSVFKFPKKNIFESVLPFIYLMRILNYFNFTIEGNLTNAVIKVKAFNIIAFLAYRLVYVPAIIVSIMNGPETYNSFLMDTGNYFFFVVCQTAGLLSVIIQFMTSSLYWDVLQQCYEIDRILEQFKIVVNHHKYFITYLKMVAFGLITFNLINTISILLFNSSLLQNFIPFGNLCVLFVFYSIHLSVIIVRFESINLCLM